MVLEGSHKRLGTVTGSVPKHVSPITTGETYLISEACQVARLVKQRVAKILSMLYMICGDAHCSFTLFKNIKPGNGNSEILVGTHLDSLKKDAW
ncbi:hypothetical protein Y032_0344g3076 [Ancylostoma ceylanicum]|uniref:Uncharacterized protein n=1 Tax=Ancylostoma ceylanicum TaxID=53326 RepID=A0A016RXG2_9BILA|nr:hypothetical protein Y032_0344g3076 [Ancylostoma ceylanicum]